MTERGPGSTAAETETGRAGLLDGNEKALIRPVLESFRTEGPDFSEFTDVYSPQEIGESVMRVQTKREKAEQDTPEEKEREVYSQIMEKVLVEFGNAWFPGCSITRASEYDDYESYIDVVLEVADAEGNIHPLGIDAVTGRRGAGDKLEKITRDLYKGALGELKFYASDLGNAHGAREVPRVIVGTDDLQSLAQMARLYLSYQAATAERKALFAKAIEDHPLGPELVQQILFQLDAFPLYVERGAKRNPKLAERAEAAKKEFAAIGTRIRELVPEKEKAPGQTLADRGGLNGVSKALVGFETKAA